MRIQLTFSSIASVALLITCPIVASAGQHWDIMSHESPVKKLHGVVLSADDKPLREVKVEVFKNPEVLLKSNHYAERMAREPIASTVTDTDGKFSLPDLPRGKYELRFTKYEFNTLSVIVNFSPKKKRASGRPLRISMWLAT